MSRTTEQEAREIAGVTYPDKDGITKALLATDLTARREELKLVVSWWAKSGHQSPTYLQEIERRLKELG
jgi:hypothetical protein